jgi:phospholipase C
MANRLEELGIEHVVVLMLENRGFDHVMGWLYKAGENSNLVSHEEDGVDFIGLSTLSKDQFANLANKNPFNEKKPIAPIKGARSPKTPAYNPGEHFVHIMAQMWGKSREEVDWANPSDRASAIEKITGGLREIPPPMNGYMLDFAEEVHEEAGVTATEDIAKEILETYEPEQLPVLSGLARHYAVSDLWFCSVPSQTNTNRAFSMAGTSRGLVTNNYYDLHKDTLNPGIRILVKKSGGSHSDRLPGYPRNLFTVLSDNGVSWKVYWQDPWPPKDLSIGVEYQYVKGMLKELDGSKFADNFVKFDANSADNPLFKAAREGKLPAVSWIEPKWGGGASWHSKLRQVGNDMHPVSDTTVAEDFVSNLYDALTRKEDGSVNPSWEKTLFVITFDENGGTYDHFPPPPADPTSRDRSPFPDDYPHMDKKTRTEFGFKFDQFGIRVPTLLVSPFVKQKTIFRSSTTTPYDHTSMIATILDWQGIPKSEWLLGARVANAPLFDKVLELDGSTVRKPNDDAVGIRYSASLGVERPDSDPIQYGEDVYLELIGSKWGNVSANRYLSKAQWGGITARAWYPTLTSEKESAQTFKLYGDKKRRTGVVIDNMSIIRIATNETSVKAKNVLGAFHDSHYLYYYEPITHSGERWQVRLLSSRDPEDVLRDGDEVVFMSQLIPTMTQSVSARVTPDPYYRMTVSPKDDKYLTSRAGEWAIWRIRKSIA